MNQTNLEQVLSSDLNRMGKLAGAELEDHDLLRSSPSDSYYAPSNTFDDFADYPKQQPPISGLTKAPYAVAVPGTYNLRIGPFEGEMFNSTPAADESAFQLLRTGGELVVLCPAPDSSNPKICLICATPGDVLTDQTSRNILVNPSTRQTTAANVFKTSFPNSVLTVVPGTPAAAPLPPAVPVGTQALFEVYQPAGASDATAFQILRRAWRRIEFPGTSQHGIVKGCVPALNATYSSLPDGLHRLVIDGELLTWSQTKGIPLQADANATPGAAPANNDMPTFLYLCGGRHSPFRIVTQYPTSDFGNCAPVALLESTTAPDAFGYPKADLALTGQSFSRSACCFIGLGFRAAGGTAQLPAFYEGDWIRSSKSVTVSVSGGLAIAIRGFKELPSTGVISGGSLALASLPSVSTGIELTIGAYFTTTGSQKLYAGGEYVSDLFSPASAGLPFTGYAPRTVVQRSHATGLTIDVPSGCTALVVPSAYNMLVPRLAR
jgi:hypothetical protein